MTGVKINHKTVQRWATGYAGLMDRYLDMIIPQVGEKWRTDEICIMIRGDCKCLFAMLGNDTGYWLAKMVAEHKGNDDVEPLFRIAKRLADKVPKTLVSDGVTNFGYAYRKQCAAKNLLHKDASTSGTSTWRTTRTTTRWNPSTATRYATARRSYEGSRKTIRPS